MVRNRPDVVETWSDYDVVRRALTINKLARNMNGELVEPAAQEIEKELAKPGQVKKYRKRLSSISWFMKALRENISLRANAEDETTGAFWDGRFRCRSLEDQASILVCGIYVDLNQIHAAEAQTPEESTHTSAYDRIISRQLQVSASDADSSDGRICGLLPDGWLTELTLSHGLDANVQDGLRSESGRRASDKGILDVNRDQYLNLLDFTGRQLRSDKYGAIPQDLAPILERLHIQQNYWVAAVAQFDTWFFNAVGNAEAVRTVAARADRRWCHGMKHCRQVFG